MNFRIADTFTDSLTKLTGDEQKRVKITVFDLQSNPSSSGHSFHKLDRAKDKHFWSVRASRDIRIIVHKTDASLLMCYVDHHDKAYLWAERRKLETHPKTGAAQLVEVRERVEEIVIPVYTEQEQLPLNKPLLFVDVSDDDLLSYGVPSEWLADVHAADEDSILELADHLPAEAAEALLDIAVGVTPKVPVPLVAGGDPFAHPDAQRRFRIMTNVDELERALDAPWEKWMVFLHPDQRQWVEKDYSGPARVSGSAGTGKTIVALHRAVYLARNLPDARVLLSTFSPTLANALHAKLKRLISNEPRLAERLEVHSMDEIGQRLYDRHFGKSKIASAKTIKSLLAAAAAETGVTKFSEAFLFAEWRQVVDAWQIASWDEYRDVTRLGRKTRLPETQRQQLWRVFETVIEGLKSQGVLTQAQMFTQLAERLNETKHPAFEYIVVDEAQDINVPQLRFLAAIGANRPNALFFAGDLGQRIFQLPFSWKALGVDIRGRSRTLHINYRTSHQIRMQADKLLGPEVSDVDGNTEERTGTISVFNGPAPAMLECDSPENEIEKVAAWINDRVEEGIQPHEVGVFIRSDQELSRATAAVDKTILSYRVLDESVATTHGHVSICTMHQAKGLEFRAVVVMACDDEILPLQSRIEEVTDDADLDEVYTTERHLLYVACTRARDHLLITSGDMPSEFLGDLTV
ncbi:UvrD-helicase domain-containing protein [Pseudomonadales bacterium]|nr:UvrD-helicase domain-containing protein [Pseudomonadales bacterium]